MPDRPSLRPDTEALALTCRCDWEGTLRSITEYAIEPDRDRVLRCCPDCGEGIAEWGVLTPIEGVARVAKGPLKQALLDAGVDVE